MSLTTKHQFKPQLDVLEDRTFMSAGLIGNLQHGLQTAQAQTRRQHVQPEAKRRIKIKKKTIKVGGFKLSIPVPVISAPTIKTPSPSPVAAQTLGDKVKQYAMDRLGQKVGDGECATLADEALRYAGAKTFWQLGPTGTTAHYVWGTEVVYRNIARGIYETMGSYSDVRPGDVIQYQNVQIYSKTTYPDGSWTSSSASYPHHTAIVAANLGNGKFQVLEQNVGPSGKTDAQKRIVQLNTVNFANMTSGLISIYRPKK